MTGAEPALELTTARYLCLAVPAALTLVAAAVDRSRSGRAAALLAFLAAAVGIAALHEVSHRAGWYAFAPVAGAYRGLPVDVWLGWAALWGPVPVLLRRMLPVPVALGLLLWLDVLTMPALPALVTLGPHWLVGELVGLLAVALPAQLLGRWSAQRRRLVPRVLLQLLVFSGLLLWLVPTAAFTVGDGSWDRVLAWGAPGLLVLAQLGLLVAVPGLAAVRELARAGGGTPYPWDPPRRLVTTGPYAYLANPMQVSAVALLLLLAAAAGSLALVGAAAAAVAFSVALAAPHERAALRRRYGAQWDAYRRRVRDWWPRWRPYRDGVPPAVLWLDPGCASCRAVARFLLRRSPVRLSLAAADAHPRVLWRARYEPAAGFGTQLDDPSADSPSADSPGADSPGADSPGADSPGADGVAAVARGLEHVTLGWAYVGWLCRVPGIGALAQLVTDALVAPPHPARAGTGTEGGGCPSPDQTPNGGCWTARSRRSGSTGSRASRPAPSPPPPG